jgi:hypothetical protein
MTRKKTTARKTKSGVSPQKLTSQRLEELLEEGHRLRRIVHERLEKARSVREDAMMLHVQ